MSIPSTPNHLRLTRRQVLGAGAVLGGALLASSRMANAQTNGEGQVSSRQTKDKQWAVDALRGGESFLMPSLLPDFSGLDEAGIRRDVQHSIAHGLCSIMPLPLGLNGEQAQQMTRVVADAARGKINTVGVILPGTWEQHRESIRSMEALGMSHALIYFDSALPDQDAIYQKMRAIIDNTSLGIVLYAKPKSAIKHLDPTGLPLAAFDRLADIDNVVGVKFTQTLRPATAYALAETLGDRLLLAVVDLEIMLVLAAKYPMQWSGQWGIESLQSPDQPWVGEFLSLLRTGQQRQAYELYWQYESIASAFYQLQKPSLSIGGHPWLHIKYMKWLTGGNGGLLPDLKTSPELVPHLDQRGRDQCRAAFEQVGINTNSLPDEAFVVGTSAWEQGVRVSDLPALPQYVA